MSPKVSSWSSDARSTSSSAGEASRNGSGSTRSRAQGSSPPRAARASGAVGRAEAAEASSTADAEAAVTIASSATFASARAADGGPGVSLTTRLVTSAALHGLTPAMPGTCRLPFMVTAKRAFFLEKSRWRNRIRGASRAASGAGLKAGGPALVGSAARRKSSSTSRYAANSGTSCQSSASHAALRSRSGVSSPPFLVRRVRRAARSSPRGM